LQIRFPNRVVAVVVVIGNVVIGNVVIGNVVFVNVVVVIASVVIVNIVHVVVIVIVVVVTCLAYILVTLRKLAVLHCYHSLVKKPLDLLKSLMLKKS
jgi:hypothetical protein